jgi:inorganic pyrophosphatase
MVLASSGVVTAFVLICPVIGLIFALIYTRATAAISFSSKESHGALQEQASQVKVVAELTEMIADGAHSFLYREYTYMAAFVIVFFVIVTVVVGAGKNNYNDGAFAAVAFTFGAVTSILAGLLGMKIAVFANGRTALMCAQSVNAGFRTAFKAGAVMGFSLISMGLLVLFCVINLFRLYYGEAFKDQEVTKRMYEAIAGYGLGGSSIALFGRVGGGIYTKAADVGADLVGKVEKGIPEDDPRNPAVIADNVGDNVGDIAGMGADLFGSFAEATCAAMVISSQGGLYNSYTAMTFPLLITASGIIVCIITSLFATHFMQVHHISQVERILKLQLIISTVLQTPVLFLLTTYFLPDTFNISNKTDVKNWYCFFCIAVGLWTGLIIGLVTEYFTSNTYSPVLQVCEACQTGAATNIIAGLALGYKSCIIPVFFIAVTIYVSYSLCGMYGIALAALGILSTMSIGLTIDAYGPISDNAGGIAEMAELGEEVREVTDALDAAGNTTAAIGKGFAIGSAALVSLALFGGYVTITELSNVDLLEPFVFAGLLIGAMLPYWFSAMTMASVGRAAQSMVEEVRRQFREIPGIMEGNSKPDYAKCIQISTDASLHEMVAPGLLVILSPIVVGLLFGQLALAGLLAGALVSGVQIAISSSNTGGAWDNCKKYYEKIGKKGTDVHKAAVVGDTVGDPLKDTSGPSLNILIKLMAIISLVFAAAIPREGYLVQLFSKN